MDNYVISTKEIKRLPNKKEIYDYIKSILCIKLYNNKINTQQYRSILGNARKIEKEPCKENLQNWFIKHYPHNWEDIENYINTEHEYLETTFSVRFKNPVISENIDFGIIKSN